MRNSPMQNAAYAAWNSFYKAARRRITSATCSLHAGSLPTWILRQETLMQVKTQGLIIREQTVGESDRLVTVLTRDAAWCVRLPAAPKT